MMVIQRRNASRSLRLGFIAALPLLGALLIGCSQRLEPIFDSPQRHLAWPSAPAQERIRYVGQLASSADLKPPRRPFQAIGDFLLGAKDPQRLYGPRAVVRTSDGTGLWIADPGGRCVHVFDLQDRDYRKIEFVGRSHLRYPIGLCLGPQESIFVCDAEDDTIHRFAQRDAILLESWRLEDEMGRPVSLSYDAEEEELFVVDVAAHHIKVLGMDGRLRRVIGQRGSGLGEFNYPCDITVDGNVIWVVDTGNNRVQGLSREGRPRFSFGQAGDNPGDMAMPKGIAVDGDGHVYVVDARFENVQIFDRAGTLLLFFGEEGTGPGQFWLPAGIFIDREDRIWVCDPYNGRIQVFDYISLTGDEAAEGHGDEGRGMPRRSGSVSNASAECVDARQACSKTPRTSSVPAWEKEGLG